MHCLTSASLWSLLPNWIQSLWIPSGEQSRDRLDQTIPNVSNPYTGTIPAVYKLQNTEVAYNATKPLPVCISNQTERLARARTPLKHYLCEFSYEVRAFLYCFLTLQLPANRPRAIAIESDDNTDCEIIELPAIKFVNGKIICVEEDHLSPKWSTTRLKKKKTKKNKL